MIGPFSLFVLQQPKAASSAEFGRMVECQRGRQGALFERRGGTLKAALQSMKSLLLAAFWALFSSIFDPVDAIPFDSGSGRPSNGRLLYGWGRDNFNQLCQGDDVPPREINSMPTLVNTKIFLQAEGDGYVNLSKVFSGGEFGFALASEGNKVYSWGRNDKGQLVQSTFSPTSLFGVSRITQDKLKYLALGRDHIMSIFDIQPGAS